MVGSRRFRCQIVVLWLCGVVLSSAGGASPLKAQDAAAEASEERDAKARTLYEAGVVQFDAANYRAARELFTDAYSLSGRKVLLYNIALSSDRLGEKQTALERYEEFLASDPNGPRADEVGRRIRSLKAELAQEKSKQAPTPAEVAKAELASGAQTSTPAASSNDQATPLRKKWWLWASIGGAVVVGVVAGVLAATRDPGVNDPNGGTTGRVISVPTSGGAR